MYIVYVLLLFVQINGNAPECIFGCSPRGEEQGVNVVTV
jgi:hypothetical protein